MSLDLKRLQGAALAPVLPALINSFTGNTTALSWNVTGATSVSINQGIGAVDFIGSRNLTSPFNTMGGNRTYTLTAIIEQFTTSASVTVYWADSCIWDERDLPEWC
jgi:hypothetical protein